MLHALEFYDCMYSATAQDSRFISGQQPDQGEDVCLQVEGIQQGHELQDSLASPSQAISNFVTVSNLHSNS